METFVDVKQMLKEFHHLLQCTPAILSSACVAQLLLMSMFSVEHVVLKDMPQNSALVEHALNLMLAMVSMIMECCCSMYEDCVQLNTQIT